MAYYTTYSGGRPAASYHGDETFHQRIPAGHQHPDDFMILESNFYQQPRSSYTHFQSQSQPHWEQNFLKDSGPYVPGNIQHMHLPHAACVEGVPPYPGRYSSPPSQSTCSSSMRSPNMESETAFPPTPQDPSLSSVQTQYDGSFFQYADDTAMRTRSAFTHSTIDPTWMHSSPQPQMESPGQVISDFGNFDLNQSTCSPSSSSPGSPRESHPSIRMPQHSQEALAARLSPEDSVPVEDEIVAHTYPEPSQTRSYEAMDEDDEYQAAPTKDDDSDYIPKPKMRNASSRKSQAPNGRGQKRSTDLRSSRGAKKPRTAGPANNHRSHAAPSSSKSIFCTSCHQELSDTASLQEHMRSTHARPFNCVFDFSGCTATFGSKNEWKRHVLSQHVLLIYWICTEPSCVDSYKESGGAIFNRKDLYTQHVRRMHTPAEYRKSPKSRNNKSSPEWDEQLRHMQELAVRNRCQLPTFLRCPARGCNLEFNGVSAWDDRMEHVARHLEKAAAGDEPEVVFGGEQDPTLNNWAASREVGIIRRVGGEDKWELATPLKTTSQGSGARHARNDQTDGSEDGHWEAE